MRAAGDRPSRPSAIEMLPAAPERRLATLGGLAALLAVGPRDEPEELQHLPVSLIDPNPRQPRQRFDEEALGALADSIRVRGQIQPVLVRPLPSGRYELIAGERRWRAAQLADRETVLAMVRQHDDAAALEVALIENMVREDLNPVDEARACAALVEELGLTREDVGLRVGRSRVAVSNLLRLLELPSEVLELLERGTLTEGHGRALLLAAGDDARRELAVRSASAGWSVRELEHRSRATLRPANPVHPPPAPEDESDRRRVIDQMTQVLDDLFGTDVRVTAGRGGYTARLTFVTLDEVLELRRRLRAGHAG